MNIKNENLIALDFIEFKKKEIEKLKNIIINIKDKENEINNLLNSVKSSDEETYNDKLKILENEIILLYNNFFPELISNIKDKNLIALNFIEFRKKIFFDLDVYFKFLKFDFYIEQSEYFKDFYGKNEIYEIDRINFHKTIFYKKLKHFINFFLQKKRSLNIELKEIMKIAKLKKKEFEKCFYKIPKKKEYYKCNFNFKELMLHYFGLDIDTNKYISNYDSLVCSYQNYELNILKKNIEDYLLINLKKNLDFFNNKYPNFKKELFNFYIYFLLKIIICNLRISLNFQKEELKFVINDILEYIESKENFKDYIDENFLNKKIIDDFIKYEYFSPESLKKK